MRVGIDARLLEREMTGIGRFLAGVLDELAAAGGENEYYLFSVNEMENWKQKGFKVIATGRNALVPGFLFSPFWMNFILPGFLAKNGIEAFFSPTGFLPLAGGKYRTLTAVCDVFHKIDKSFHSLFYRIYADLFLTPSVRKSDSVVTISENSKKDIVKFYGVPEEKIKVAYLAADKIFQPRQLSSEQKKNIREKYGLPEKFILYVGVIEERKNIRALLGSAGLLKKETDIPILLFGKIGYRGRKYLEEISARENIKYLGFADNEDLPLLYNLAEAFLFPTFYEGFGLPVLEAMQSGLPVVCSDTSSLPEIAGKNGMVCRPDNYRCFTKWIIKLLKDRDFYDNIRRNEIERAKDFGWGKTAGVIINLLKKL